MVKVYGKQVLSPDCDTAGSQEVFEAGKMFVKEMKSVATKKGFID